ncbi:hypothetical protein [uncultured Roseobacter sp.]|uniref:hypothetical protein n=1 Tax=uncultured Roseobacter sp. TaxID=114847 RepID=UPI00261AB1B3|nr:hypothetical protein [uncultured Roseobacter sp.]
MVLTSAAVCFGCGLASAETMSELIDASIGHVKIRDNVVFIETETGGSFCKIDVGDEVFTAFAQGAPVSGSNITCFPYGLLDADFVSSGKRDFTDFIDDSEGYENVRDGVILVQDGAATSLCQVAISDDDFTRFAAEGTSGVQDARAVCVAIDELES